MPEDDIVRLKEWSQIYRDPYNLTFPDGEIVGIKGGFGNFFRVLIDGEEFGLKIFDLSGRSSLDKNIRAKSDKKYFSKWKNSAVLAKPV